MSWETLAKKQPKVIRILTNSIEKERLAHAYIFEGGAGTGKKETAQHLIKRYYCESPQGTEPCHECSNCRRVDSGNHPDVYWIKPDGSTIKIEQIRLLQKEFSWKGVEGKGKAYIIEDADLMSPQAANGLLKFLEEPKSQTIAVLLTTQKQRILNTILSRCQVLSFNQLNTSELVKTLEAEGVRKSIASLVAHLTSDYQQAKLLCEDEWFTQAKNIVIQLAEEISERPEQAVFTIQSHWMPHFQNRQQQQLGLDLLLLWYRDLLHSKQGREVVYQESKLNQKEQIDHYLISAILEQIETLLQAKSKIASNTNPQMVLEQLVFKLTQLIVA